MLKLILLKIIKLIYLFRGRTAPLYYLMMEPISQLALGLLMGLSMLRWLPALPSAAGWILLWLSSGVAILFMKRTSIPGRVMLAGILIGVMWGCWRAEKLLTLQLPLRYENKRVTVTGVIATRPSRRDRITRFLFSVNRLAGKALPKALLVRLSVYGYGHKPSLAVGQQWHWTVKLKRPRTWYNPGGFDSRLALLRQGIGASGYVVLKAPHRLLSDKRYHYPLQNLRQWIYRHLSAALGKEPLGGIVLALVLGERDKISPQQWDTLRVTGTSHLVAISGLHIGLVAGLVFWLLKLFWGRLGLCIYWPAQKAAILGALLVGAFYSALAGFALPTQRALVMLGIVAIHILWDLPPGFWRQLAWTLLVILAWEPLAVFSSSFWLSFTAVFLIGYSMGQRVHNTGLWWRFGRLQWVMALGLLPLSFALFQQASWISPLANFLAVPWMSVIGIPLVLLAAFISLCVPALAPTLLELSLWPIRLLWHFLTYLAQLPGVHWYHSWAHPWFMVLFMASILLVLAPRGLPARWLGSLGFLLLFFPKTAFLPANSARLTFLQVGQGLAVVLQTAQHVLVYDTGPQLSPTFSGGTAAVLPYLRSQGIQQVDAIVISHADADHRGGLNAILAQLPVKKLISSVDSPVLPPLTGHCRQGQHWQWDGVRFEFLYPSPQLARPGNAGACVLSIQVGQHRVLLTGDIEKAQERYLVKRMPAKLRADILSAPHHGSNTSSTRAFLNAVHPHYAVFSVGYANRFGFPHPQVLARYASQGIKIAETWQTGALTFFLQANQPLLPPQAYKQATKRFWYSVPGGKP